jgi:hypothetical protein
MQSHKSANIQQIDKDFIDLYCSHFCLLLLSIPATAGVPSVAGVHVIVFFRHIAATVSDINAFAAMPFLFYICKVVWSCFISEMYTKLEFSASELAIFFLDSTVSVSVVRIFPSFWKLPKNSTSYGKFSL